MQPTSYDLLLEIRTIQRLILHELKKAKPVDIGDAISDWFVKHRPSETDCPAPPLPDVASSDLSDDVGIFW